jgi:hypothetical protein
MLFCLIGRCHNGDVDFFGFAMIYKNALWIQNLNLSRIIFLILTGGIGAIQAETRHLSIGTMPQLCP